MPTYTLHHLVKERYPRFVDALGDLDDALTLSYLFAALPSERGIKPKVINKAKALVAAWGAYCATTHCITKSFISVKGVYLEASVKSVPIRWVIPHSFTQYVPEDVDYRVMMTFFEFYEQLLGFVLFKLYNDIGVQYPLPAATTTAIAIGKEGVGSTSAILGANLVALQNALDSSDGAVGATVGALVEEQQQKDVAPKDKASVKAAKKAAKKRIESVEAMIKTLDQDGEEEEDEEEGGADISDSLQAALKSMDDEEMKNTTSVEGKAIELDEEGMQRKRLFAGLTFFLSREIPRGYLELVCLAYGGKIGWEGDDNSPVSIRDTKITHHIVDRPKLPSSYDSLPKSREFVQPQWIIDSANFLFCLPVARYAAGAMLPPHLSPWVDDEEEGYKPAYAEEIERLKNGEIADGDFVAKAGHDDTAKAQEMDVDEESDSTSREASDDESEDDSIDSDNAKKRKQKERRRQQEEEEAHTLAKTMMNRKAAHLYGRMQHGLAQKQAKIEELQQRRKQQEQSSKEKDESGKSAQKQKVERLKKERRAIEESYAKTEGSMKKRKKARKSH